MLEHLKHWVQENMTILSTGTVVVNAAHWFEVVQNVIVTVGSLCGSMLVIWAMIDKIRLTLKKSRRETDVRKGDKVDG